MPKWIEWMMGGVTRRKRVGLAMLIAAWLGSGAHAARAEETVDCDEGTNETITLKMPASITVSPTMKDGTLLSLWIQSVSNPNYYTCKFSKYDGHGISMVFRPNNLIDSGMTITSLYKKYTVWNTNLPGIGIAIGASVRSSACGNTTWDNIESLVHDAGSGWHGAFCSTASRSLSTGGALIVALVKTGNVTEGTLSGVVALGALARSPDISNPPFTIGSTRKSYVLSPVKVVAPSCSTPDLTVEMGSYQQSTFKGIGSTTIAKAFNVAVYNCPSGLSRLSYTFTPVGAVADAANGVLALADDSTASGIGLQLKDGNNKALKYDTPYVISAYNTATGGSYTIPLKAAYYQTEAKVKPGSANTRLTITMTYQ